MITPVERKRLYNAILSVFKNGKKYTARECAVKLKNKGICQYGLRQETQPRIVELIQMGELERVGSKIDKTTHKKVTIYRMVGYEEL